MTALSGARALVTGAAGFIGSCLVEALSHTGAEVHGVVRSGTPDAKLVDIRDRMHVHRGDVAEAANMKSVMTRIRPEIIFHLAVTGGSGATPAERLAAVRVNVVGTACVLEAAGEVGYDRFVHVGSALEYAPKEGPIGESDPIAPMSYRGITKAAATLLALGAARWEGRRIVVLRPFGVYGPRAPSRGLVPTAIRAVLSGDPIDLTVPGYRRDYVYVDDVAQACLLAAEAAIAPGDVVNIGSGKQYSNEEVVELIQAICGRWTEVRIGTHEARPHDQNSWVADTETSVRLLGWRAEHDIEDGLKKTIDFVSARL